MINLDIGVLVGLCTIIVMLTSLIAYIVGIKFSVKSAREEILSLKSEIQSLRCDFSNNVKDIYSRINEQEIKQAKMETKITSLDRRKYQEENEKD